MFGSKLQKQIDELKKEIDLIKNMDVRLEIEKLKTHMISLRGLVNRRLGKEDLKEDQSKDIYSGMLLPE